MLVRLSEVVVLCILVIVALRRWQRNLGFLTTTSLFKGNVEAESRISIVRSPKATSMNHVGVANQYLSKSGFPTVTSSNSSTNVLVEDL